MRQNVFVLILANDLKFLWTVCGGFHRMPVKELAPGLVRPFSDKADNLEFLDVLDAIMAERRAGTYSTEGIEEWSPCVKIVEMEVQEGQECCYPDCWGIIVFSDSDIDLGFYQGRVDYARQALA